MGLQRFPIGNFRGGLNLRDAPAELTENEAQDLLNVTLADVIGSLQQRGGKTRFDTAASHPAAKRAENMKAWYPNAAMKLLVLSIDGTIYTCTPGGVLTSRFAGTAGTVWAFEQATDSANTQYLWCMNGTDAPQKMATDGTCGAWANSPPNGTILKLWKNRMCVSGVAATPQRVFFSNIGDPEGPAATYGTQWVDIKGTEDDRDSITNLVVYVDQLYVFKRGSVWNVTNSSSPWDNARVAAAGCEDRFQAAVLNQKLYFFNRRGIWSLDPEKVLKEESDSVSPLWIGATPRLNFAQISKARLIATNKGRILCAMPFDNSTENNYVLELIPNLNFRRIGGRHYIVLPAIVLHDYPVSSLAVFRPGNLDVVIGATTAKLHTLFSGLNDDGVAINAYWKSGWKSLVAEEPKERIRRINVEMEGSAWIDVFVDFGHAVKFTKQFTIPAENDATWDGGVWDGGTWDGESAFLGRVRPETRGRYHCIQFRNSTLNNTFKIHTAELALRGGKEH